MRFNLNLTYVLRRTCDHSDDCPRTWVAWCPELDIVSQGPGPDGAVWMLRDAIRLSIESDIAAGVHPARRGRKASEDEDWDLYQEFLNRFMDDECDETWLRCYGHRHLPDYVDIAFIHNRTDVDTFGYDCHVSDEWYGELWYKNAGMVDVTATVRMTYRVDANETDHVGWIRHHYGHTVGEILSVEPAARRRS